MVADHDVDHVWVGSGKVFQIAVVPFLVNRRDLTEVRLASDDIKSAVEVGQFVFDLARHHGASALAGPKPPDLGVQTEPGLIHHPSFHSASFSDFEGFQTPCEFLPEHFGCRRILLGVAWARHQQDSSGFF